MKTNKLFSPLFRFYLKIKKEFNQDIPLTEHQKFSIDICKKLISMDSTILLFAPLSGTKLIKNEDKQISAILQGRTITIINKIYTYTTYIENDSSFFSLSSYFDLKLEKNTKKVEEEINDSVAGSLKIIMNRLTL